MNSGSTVRKPRFRVVITDHAFPSVEQERQTIEAAGGELVVAECSTPQSVIEAGLEADALLVQWAPISAQVISKLNRCKVIVRYGVGLDNVDLEAARRKRIAVANVPDYCVDEVADHTMALALALVRRLPLLDQRFRNGVWISEALKPMPACERMTFGVIGFGRIGRAVLQRAQCFKFKLAAYDPYAKDETLQQDNVARLSLDELVAQADILSLHAPLTTDTQHLINADRLSRMKPSSILINTARGKLIDNTALARSLLSGQIAFAGIDVFEVEPLPASHLLLKSPNVLLTPHVAWCSDLSLQRLQRLAAEEIVRRLSQEGLLQRVASASANSRNQLRTT